MARPWYATGDSVSGSAAFSQPSWSRNLGAFVSLSYTWFVWSGLFLQASLGVELHLPGDDPVLAGEEFQRPQLQPSPGVMVGYRF